ncbi:Rhodocoxin reductase [Rhodoplanes serenus]|uniref:Rhodocoxin reductase n=1 Tax=Rhodoplanes serenus TaxID=200615 RepID=A0A447CZX9_9BRAD|nr:FAD-dependent oxidoreductase [Rhodoplanes serenus]VCU10856.1 Rhodocoxin reductase [Rhodoplanes serenus]
MSQGPLVVVGASCAGVSLAMATRDLGSERPIVLVGDEPDLPYHRPPLSKAFLAGKAEESTLALRPESLLASLGIEIVAGTAVTVIDRTARRVITANGRRIAYDHLALTTGSRARTLAIAGTADNVLTLRTLADARRLRAAVATCREVVIVGGGFVGLEVAATLAAAGAAVTVVETEQRLLKRAVSPAVSDAVMRLHTRHGVGLRLGARVIAIDRAGDRARAVRLDDGSVLPCDLVVVGIGAVANDELAAAAGLPCRDGVLVDPEGRTTDPHIVAAGDCARHPSRFADGRLVRLESVQNATDQARAAAAVLHGLPQPYDKVPWFWSDQYDVKIQIAGLVDEPDTSVLRGNAEDGRFSVFHFRAGRLIGAESLGRPGDHLFARRCLGEHLAVTPAMLADAGTDLAALATAARAAAAAPSRTS